MSSLVDTLPRTEVGTDKLVNSYLSEVLGTEYYANAGEQHRHLLTFFICYAGVDSKQHPVVGYLTVDATVPKIHALTDEQVREIRECAAWENARIQGRLARGADGYVMRHQARRLARRWISDQLTMNFSVTGGIFVPLKSPIWQFAITFHLGAVHLEPLCTIDVNALTGDVQPLSHTQLKTIEERVHAIIQFQTLATAA